MRTSLNGFRLVRAIRRWDGSSRYPCGLCRLRELHRSDVQKSGSASQTIGHSGDMPTVLSPARRMQHPPSCALNLWPHEPSPRRFVLLRARVHARGPDSAVVFRVLGGVFHVGCAARVEGSSTLVFSDIARTAWRHCAAGDRVGSVLKHLRLLGPGRP